MDSERLTIAMTGATGALGAVVLGELLRRGHRVRALVRALGGPRLPARDDLVEVAGGLDDPAALDALVSGSDAILHLAYCPFDERPPAGRSTAEHFAQTNVAGTIRLIERTPATRLRQLVFASTLAVFGPNPHRLPGAERLPLDEDFPVWPREFYGGHKAALEKLVIAAAGEPGMNASAWRIGCVLGRYADRGRDPLAPLVDDALVHGAIRTRKGAYVVCAEDVAAILADALGDASVRGQVFHVFDRWLDFASIAAPLGEILGRRIGVEVDPAPAPRPALVRDRLLARDPRFTTDARLPELLAALLRDQPS